MAALSSQRKTTMTMYEHNCSISTTVLYKISIVHGTAGHRMLNIMTSCMLDGYILISSHHNNKTKCIYDYYRGLHWPL